MARPRKWIALVGMLGAIGCRPPALPPLPPDAAERLAEQPFREDALPKEAKIFLVAGGTDSANFAQEIVDQRRIWIEAGFSADEIACYWAKPTPEAFEADGPQYHALAQQLEACWRATPGQVFEHLAVAAERKPPFVYLYVSSHGTHSILEESKEYEDDRRALQSASECDKDALDQPAIVMGGDAAGSLDVPSLLDAMHAGEGDDTVFTPANLRRALASFPAETEKVVVLQACYSGGFVDRDGKRRTQDGISDLPNLTAITAARYDRTSFGCQTGEETTYFGSAYNRVLDRTPGLHSPETVHWRTLYLRARHLVERREDGHEANRSLPRFFHSPASIETNPKLDEPRCKDR